ncbi:MC family mitochondrial carrier protein [Cadophora sp. MPI-SDFR-AT-0126]|nr:MC family mitochondrial carrier protein [Leotiomycetes sp. MPI-SDFR-AT-0126]
MTASGTGHIVYPFWFGGSSATMAACFTHPLDLVKVRLQTGKHGGSTSMIRMFPHIISVEGVRGVYSGLSAALMRQMTYSTVRFGTYEYLKLRYQPHSTRSNPNPEISSMTLIVISGLCGFTGGVVGNPADILNVRMQSDGAKPLESRKNYKNGLDGLVRMIREEGLRSTMSGVGPNGFRAFLMNASQLASYDIFKSLYLTKFGITDNLVTYLAALLSAALVATTVCSPIDVIKTRATGFWWIFRGWVPSFIRLGPQTACTLVLFERHKRLYRYLTNH